VHRPVVASDGAVTRIDLFGGAILTAASGPITGRAAQRHRIALVALLATTRRFYRSRDQLVAFLWPDADAERGRKLLSDSIYRINQALGGDAITGTGDDVRLNRIQVASDVADFEAALEAREWKRAVDLYTGPFLDGFFLPGAAEFDHWMESERAHYARAAGKAIDALAVDARDAGRIDEAADWWQRLAVMAPEDSRVAMELMRALELSGNRAGALRHARVHSLVLRETLGVEPDHSVGALAEQIARRGAASGAPATAAETTPTTLDAGGVEVPERPDTAAALPAADAPEPDVDDLYLRALFQWHQRTEDCLRNAASLFERVVEREPEHPRAWVGLADAYAVLAFYDFLPPRVAFPRAECAAKQAVRLAPTMAAPYATLAFVDTYYHWSWATAERGFRRAIELEPSYATAHQWYGGLLVARGRFDEAECEMRRGAELDPLSMAAHAAIGWVLSLANQNDRAIRHLRGALQLDPDFPLALYHLGIALEQDGQRAEAIRVLERALERARDCTIVGAALARTHAANGDIEPARALLASLLEREDRGRYISSYGIGKVYHALGDTPAAMTRFERAYRDRAHSMALLEIDPQLRSLAGDARFAQLIERVSAPVGPLVASTARPSLDVRAPEESAFSYA
jgi:DNA-binding SARP family transcriptional activator/Tfp pilus assembly protein PilF